MNNGAGARSASTDSIIIQIIHRQTHTDSLSYDIITHTLDPIQDRIHIQPVRKLSVSLKNDTAEHQETTLDAYGAIKTNKGSRALPTSMTR